MVNSFVKRKKEESDAAEGKDKPDIERRRQIIAGIRAKESFGGGEYPLLKSKRVASGN